MLEVRALTTDAVIEFDGEVLLLKRNHPPFEASWVLPGGFVEQDETARDACIRETGEEVGVDVSVEEFIGLYDDPDRDKQGNVSAAYRCSIRSDILPRLKTRASHPITGRSILKCESLRFLTDNSGSATLPLLYPIRTSSYLVVLCRLAWSAYSFDSS